MTPSMCRSSRHWHLCCRYNSAYFPQGFQHNDDKLRQEPRRKQTDNYRDISIYCTTAFSVGWWSTVGRAGLPAVPIVKCTYLLWVDKSAHRGFLDEKRRRRRHNGHCHSARDHRPAPAYPLEDGYIGDIAAEQLADINRAAKNGSAQPIEQDKSFCIALCECIQSAWACAACSQNATCLTCITLSLCQENEL